MIPMCLKGGLGEADLRTANSIQASDYTLLREHAALTFVEGVNQDEFVTPNKIKVLVVEDEPLLLMMAVDIDHDAGFEGIEAHDADEAMRFLETDADIRIMWTDIDMPGTMNGILLSAAARRGWPPIEILIVSGMTTPTAADIPARSVFFSKPTTLPR